MKSEKLLEVSDLRKSYGSLEVLKGVTFDLARGERLAIIGPSGSGKSTCLRSINYLEVPSSGRITLDGEIFGETITKSSRIRRMTDRELAPQRAQVGMVFQLFHLWPHLTVLENVAIQPHKVQGLSKKESLDLASEMLAKVHLSHKINEYPDRLSGGQQQRVAIARALAQRPKLLLFDEPTSALDPELVGEVLNVIHELADEGRSMVLVTHEIRFAKEVADRVFFMDEGVIVEGGDAKSVIENPQEPRLQRFLNQVTSPRGGGNAD